MVFPRNSHLNTIFFVISGKMIFLFSRKYDIFYLCRKWKRMIFIKKTRGNMVFLCICVGVTNMTLPSWQKSKDALVPKKIHLGVASPVSPKKMVFILENRVFFLKCYIDWHSRKGPIRSHRRCSTRKGVLRNLAKFTGKDLCRGLFFNKVTSLRPATVLKKKLRCRCFPVSFSQFLRTLLLQNTPGWLLLEFQLFSVLLWRPYRRFYIMLSSERKAGNLIHRIEIRLLFEFI